MSDGLRIEWPAEECWPPECCCSVQWATTFGDLARGKQVALVGPRHHACPLHGDDRTEAE